MAGPRSAAGLVQVRALSFPGSDRSSRRVAGVRARLAKDVEVRVWDSTAELRYLVLPERPAGSEELSEEALAALVTRDAMIGVGQDRVARGGNPRMNGVHDMGGMHDPDPIPYEKNEPVFHEPWESRAFALTRAMSAWGKWTGDASRHREN